MSIDPTGYNFTSAVVDETWYLYGSSDSTKDQLWSVDTQSLESRCISQKGKIPPQWKNPKRYGAVRNGQGSDVFFYGLNRRLFLI